MTKTIKEVIFDVETQKVFSDVKDNNPSLLGVSIVSLYKRELDNHLKEITGQIASFWENELEDMWPIFGKADRIIGFNSLHFDVPVLAPYSPPFFTKLPHFDIMQKVKEVINHRLSLNSLVKHTLGRNKIDNGLNAVYYWEKKDSKSLDKLKKYCEEDVLLTKDLYDYVLQKGELKYQDKWNEIKTIKVDFSYSLPRPSLITQNSFF